MGEVFKKGDRVVCIKGDQWSKVGWTGTVDIYAKSGDIILDIILIGWDNGKSFWTGDSGIKLLTGKNEELE